MAKKEREGDGGRWKEGEGTEGEWKGTREGDAGEMSKGWLLGRASGEGNGEGLSGRWRNVVDGSGMEYDATVLDLKTIVMRKRKHCPWLVLIHLHYFLTCGSPCLLPLVIVSLMFHSNFPSLFPYFSHSLSPFQSLLLLSSPFIFPPLSHTFPPPLPPHQPASC